MNRQGYRRPQGGNAFQQYAGSSREVNPFEADYKKLKVGGRMRLRFLDLTPEAAIVLEAREVGIVNRQNNNMMAIKAEIPGEYVRHDDGTYAFTPDPGLRNIVDHNGTPVLACKTARIYRCPVWVYFEVDDMGKVTDVDGLRYIEFTQGLRDSMDELVGFQNGAGAFNPDTGRPDYDVDLVVVPGEGSIPKNYKFEVVFLDPDTKRQDANFGKEAEEVLNDFMDQINDDWDDVMEAISRTTTIEDFEKRMQPPKESRTAASARPGLSRGTQADSGNPAPDEGTAPARPGGRRYGGR